MACANPAIFYIRYYPQVFPRSVFQIIFFYVCSDLRVGKTYSLAIFGNVLVLIELQIRAALSFGFF
tara:strand:+ start:149 stop:346 length:198 start_codon:yes stop_codon:yes gene_type:complete